MSDLMQFLTDRFADDERVARSWMSRDFLSPDPALWRAKGERDLAEVEAKRRIVEIHHPHDHHGEHGAYVFCGACQWDHGDDSPRIDMGIDEFGKPCQTLRTLAAVYADHPDYDEAWRP